MGATAASSGIEAALAETAALALRRDKNGAADALFLRVAERARRAGLRLAGALQSEEPHAGRSRCDMMLTDLATGRVSRISEDRGDLAQGCRLDAGALTEAAALIERTIRSAAPDLVILNKFGKAEAEEGGGMRDVMAAALEAGVPVLIGVAPAHERALRDFAGELCAIVEDEAAVWRWLEARLGGRATFAAAGVVAR